MFSTGWSFSESPRPHRGRDGWICRNSHRGSLAGKAMRFKHQQDLRWSREKEKGKHREDHFVGYSENSVMGHVVGVMGVVLLEESGSPKSLNHQKPPSRLTSRWTWVGRRLSKALTSLWICSQLVMNKGAISYPFLIQSTPIPNNRGEGKWQANMTKFWG